MTEAQNRPKREYTPKPKPIFDFGEVNHSNGGYTSSMAPPPSRNSGRKSDMLCLFVVVALHHLTEKLIALVLQTESDYDYDSSHIFVPVLEVHFPFRQYCIIDWPSVSMHIQFLMQRPE